MRQVVQTVRTAATRTRRATLRTERVQALGPLTMGDPLDGRYQDLHVVWWGLYWDPVRGLILERDTASGWVEVTPGQAFPVPERTMRHIGLAFDQSAHHSVCWEDRQQIVVRQWDTAQQQYAYRGPFAGVNPLLFMDTTASYYSPDSDVVLLYLNAARDTLYARYQRDVYSIEDVVATGLTDAVLDQVIALPYGAQIRGETSGAELTVDFGLYPVRQADRTAGAFGPEWGAYDLALVVADFGGDRTSASTAPSNGEYSAAVESIEAPKDAVSGHVTPESGEYSAAIMTQNPPKESAAGSMMPEPGVYALGIIYQPESTDGVTGSFAPSGGTYSL